jgi:type III pantothenate kinase
MQTIIDIGNTKVKLARFKGRTLAQLDTFEQLSDAIQALSENESGVYASVRHLNPEEETELAHRGILPLDVRGNLPVELEYNSVQTLGQDRIAGVVGARAKFDQNDILVVDAGTCITYDLLVGNRFLGGAISPGIHMRARAMNTFTNKLPLADVTRNSPEIGRNTMECLISGAKWGAIFETQERIRRLSMQYPDLICVITGGDATAFESIIKNSIFAVPNLVLYGLNEIALYEIK